MLRPPMAGGIDGEISKLRHRDVRERRRAVRVLFDTDIPRALKGFVPLLNDKDPGSDQKHWTLTDAGQWPWVQRPLNH